MSTLAVSLARAAQTVATKLPTAASLQVGKPVTDRSLLPSLASGSSVVATLSGDLDGDLVLLVGDELVAALAESPLGRLDLVPSLAPALEAAGIALGSVQVTGSRELEIALGADVLQGDGDVVAVPILSGTELFAVLAVRVAVGLPRQAPAGTPRTNGLELLRDVEMEVTAELGRTRMSVRELLSLSPGAVVELDRAAGSPCDLLVNGTLIARGEVVVVDEDFGIRVTEILTPGTDATTPGAASA